MRLPSNYTKRFGGRSLRSVPIDAECLEMIDGHVISSEFIEYHNTHILGRVGVRVSGKDRI